MDVTLQVTGATVPAASAATPATPAGSKGGAPASAAKTTANAAPQAPQTPQTPPTPPTHPEVVHTTANHPWLSADHGWLIASFLHVGEPVQQVDGSTAVVVSVRSVPSMAAMWDLTVANVHTFAVGDGAYVVHNCDDLPSGYGEAHGADNAAKLQKYAEYVNKYGDPRELPDGRIRFYGEETPPRTPGRISGSRYVKEWDPATGRTRGWIESYEADGSVRQVHPKDIDGVYIGDDTPHYLFNHGLFEGMW